MNYETFNDPVWIDNVVVRKGARKRWSCCGDGARPPKHADGCPGWIEVGDAASYIEYVGDTPLYQTGSHHTMVCALAFYTQTAARFHRLGVERPA